MAGDSAEQTGHATSFAANQVCKLTLTLACVCHRADSVPSLRGCGHKCILRHLHHLPGAALCLHAPSVLPDSALCSLAAQGHINQQPVAAIPNFGGSSPNSSTFRPLEPASVPTPGQIVRALNKFVIGQERAKRVRGVPPLARITGVSPRACPALRDSFANSTSCFRHGRVSFLYCSQAACGCAFALAFARP